MARTWNLTAVSPQVEEIDIPTVCRLEMVNEPETQTRILIQHFEDRPPISVRLTAGALFVLGALVFHRGRLH